jgi:hypothetical protein
MPLLRYNHPAHVSETSRSRRAYFPGNTLQIADTPMNVPSGFRHDSGVMLETTGQRGVAVVCRIAVHQGLSLTPAGHNTVLVNAHHADVLRWAFYAPTAAHNPWEPFDQPAPSAYMPLPYSAFQRISLGEQVGTLLIQVRARHEPLRGPVVDDGVGRTCEFLSKPTPEVLADRAIQTMERCGVPAAVAAGIRRSLVESCAPLLAGLAEEVDSPARRFNISTTDYGTKSV